jgi:colanic acid/amylovoran biosynthesis glycosyltransferase
MLTLAYLANQFPAAVEPYVGEEIAELQRRGVQVITGSVRKPRSARDGFVHDVSTPQIVLLPLRASVLLQAALLCVRKWKQISPLIGRVLFQGSEGIVTRLKALLHTWMGACYAAKLKGRGIEHIHVHHGYFGSWIGMAASRLLGVGFSLTLHGSDLLRHGVYLDVKLANCSFCLTVSDYNRRHILEHYPQIDSRKILVSRLGVELGDGANHSSMARTGKLALLAIGRLHSVKDHAFLVRACAQLQARGENFECSIAGEGPERQNLETLIRKYGLEDRVALLGHVARDQMDSLFDRADVVVLTSRSEGMPLVLMEAMARGKIVLAPSITGIPEIVVAGQTGYLFEPGSMGDFLAKLLSIRSLLAAPRPAVRSIFHSPSCSSAYLYSAARPLDWVRHAAQVQVRHNFNRAKNLSAFGDLFIRRVAGQRESFLYENSVLQQVQLSLQRNRSLSLRTNAVDAVAGP